MQDIMKMLTEYTYNHNKYFFNLLDVLVDKGILNSNDIIYIREHGTSESTEIREG